jgi:hypothetical protein
MTVKYQRRRGTLLEWVRQFNKAIFNRLILTFAGRHGGITACIRLA